MSAAGPWDLAALARSIADIHHRLETIPPRMPIAVGMAADPVSVAALLAAEDGRRPVLLLPPQVEARERENLLAAVRPAALVAPARVPWVQRLPGTGSDVAGGVMISLPLPDTSHDLGDVICQRTSGSMGPPRLAVRSRIGIEDEIHALEGRISFAGERILCASSLAHSYGLIAGLLAPARHGAAHIAFAGSAQEACRLAATTRPTLIVGLASTYQAFLDHDLPGAFLTDARVLLSAGAPLPAGLFDAFWRRYHLPIRQDYGTTETGTISLNYPDAPDPESVGVPLPHLHVRVVPAGDAGDEVQVRGRAVAAGYLDREEIRAASDGDGWYQTGDGGTVREDGRLCLGSRRREPIVVGGVPIAPDAIERALQDVSGVVEAAVVPARRGGQTAIKAVLVAPNVSEDEIRRGLARCLPPDAIPSVIMPIPALPRSPAGKILYSKLESDAPYSADQSD